MAVKGNLWFVQAIGCIVKHHISQGINFLSHNTECPNAPEINRNGGEDEMVVKTYTVNF